MVTEVVVVFRTFPIRVAGDQAGPMKDEITWEQIQRESGYPHPIQERTSVTNKVRRVACFDWELASKALLVNRPTRVAINGLDLLNFDNLGITNCGLLDPIATHFMGRITDLARCELLYLGTGPGLKDTFPCFANMFVEGSNCHVQLQSENQG